MLLEILATSEDASSRQVTHMLNPNRDLLLKNFNSTVKSAQVGIWRLWAPFFILVLDALKPGEESTVVFASTSVLWLTIGLFRGSARG